MGVGRAKSATLIEGAPTLKSPHNHNDSERPIPSSTSLYLFCAHSRQEQVSTDAATIGPAYAEVSDEARVYLLAPISAKAPATSMSVDEGSGTTAVGAAKNPYLRLVWLSVK